MDFGNFPNEVSKNWMERVRTCCLGVKEKTIDNPTVVKWTRVVLVLFIIVVIIIMSIWAVVPDSKLLSALFDAVDYVQRLPPVLSAVIMIEMFGFLVPFGCPVTPLVLVSGFLFGAIPGALIGTAGTMLGATICYLWALTLLESWAEEKLNSKRVFKAIHIAVKERSFYLIALCHLSPILPSAVLNYLFATMGIRYPLFLVATIVGTLPLAILYAYIGSLAENLAGAFNGGGSVAESAIILTFFIISTILLVVLLGWIGKLEIKKALVKLDEEEEEERENLLDGITDEEL